MASLSKIRTGRLVPYPIAGSRMFAEQPPKTRLSLDAILASAFILLNLAYESTLINLAGPEFYRISLGGMLVAVSVGIVRALMRGDVLAGALSLAVLMLIAWQMYIFSSIASYPINWNAGLSYVPMASFVLFVNCRTGIDRVLSFTFYASLFYCLVYISFASELVVMSSSVTSFRSAAKVLVADYRGERLFLAVGYAAYCMFFSLAYLKNSHGKLFWLVTFVVGAFAVYVSMSRFVSAVLLLVTVLGLLGWPRRTMRILLSIGFTAGVLINLAGVVLPDWNPYSFVASDASGFAREIAYDVLKPLVASNFLFGIGIPPAVVDFTAFVGRPFVFWEDLGPLGMWASFGLPGLLVFLSLAYMCIMGVKRNAEVSILHYQALSFTALSFGLAAVFSPDLWVGSSAVFLNMLLAMWLRSSSRSFRRKPEKPYETHIFGSIEGKHHPASG
jgi:hypothetical protein